MVLLDTGGDSRWSQQNAAVLLAKRGYSPEKVELVRRWFNGEFTKPALRLARDAAEPVQLGRQA